MACWPRPGRGCRSRASNSTHPGLDSLYGPLEPPPDDPLELVARVMFTAGDQQTLKTAVRRAMALGLSGPAGMSVSGTSVGADPRPLLGLWPALVRREAGRAGCHRHSFECLMSLS